MNITQAEQRKGEIYGKMYWHYRGTFLVESFKERRKLIREYFELKKGLESGEFPPEVKENGAFISRKSALDMVWGRKIYLRGKGWEDFLDTGYLDIVMNKSLMKVYTYCEGDITIVTCPTVNIFNQEIEELVDFYIENGDYTPFFPDAWEEFCIKETL